MHNAISQIKITPLAAESFGVRSMCTLVETSDIAILLDAGISLCPYRFNLPPHPLEFQTIAKLRQTIANAAAKTTVTTISHYHFDHHTPSYEDWIVNWTENTKTARQIYQDKIVLTKNPKANINASQRQRAWMFQKTGGKHARSWEAADGKTFQYGGTTLRFSEAVAHGTEGGMLGWVIMTSIECGEERFVHAPDVQGPMSLHTTELILAIKPDVIMLGGPPLYLAGFRVDEHQLAQGVHNLERIVETTAVVILEHHTLRDELWHQKIEPVFQAAKKRGHDVVTAAEYRGEENQCLEVKRKQLYRDHPVSDEFEHWMKTLTGKKIVRPPL